MDLQEPQACMYVIQYNEYRVNIFIIRDYQDLQDSPVKMVLMVVME